MSELSQLLQAKTRNEAYGFTPKIGDVVEIRKWDDMAEDFGTVRGGDLIPVTFGFSKWMRPLCGALGRISAVDIDGEITLVDLDPSDAEPILRRARISRQMLETPIWSKLQAYNEKYKQVLEKIAAERRLEHEKQAEREARKNTIKLAMPVPLRAFVELMEANQGLYGEYHREVLLMVGQLYNMDLSDF
jgi:hypothetical protein